MSFKRIDCDFFFCRAIDLFLLSVCGKISVKATWQWNCESIFILGNCAIFLSLSLSVRWCYGFSFIGKFDLFIQTKITWLSKLNAMPISPLLCQFHTQYQIYAYTIFSVRCVAPKFQLIRTNWSQCYFIRLKHVFVCSFSFVLRMLCVTFMCCCC